MHGPVIYSVGHGTRPLEEFLRLLEKAGMRQLADIRTAPRSTRHPHFDREAALAAGGIGYRHLRGLGGWRRARSDSPHVALRVPGFRGYADHLSSAEFARDYARLREMGAQRTTAFMCAETYW